MSPASKIQNEPEQCTRNDPEWYIWNVPTPPTIVYYFWYNSGKLWGNAGFIQNVPSFPVSQTFPFNVPKVSPNYTDDLLLNRGPATEPRKSRGGGVVLVVVRGRRQRR